MSDPQSLIDQQRAYVLSRIEDRASHHPETTMNSLEDRELRLQCVDLAVKSGNDPVLGARQILAFVTGDADQTPREKVNAALDAAGVS